eukprot:6210664-Pleurochrysis_carterae.AAC.1
MLALDDVQDSPQQLRGRIPSITSTRSWKSKRERGSVQVGRAGRRRGGQGGGESERRRVQAEAARDFGGVLPLGFQVRRSRPRLGLPCSFCLHSVSSWSFVPVCLVDTSRESRTSQQGLVAVQGQRS